MERFGWTATVREGKLPEYIKRHDELWPEMEAVLKKAGIRNYTIWNLGDKLFGYYECDDLKSALKLQAGSEVVARWDTSMAPLMTEVLPMEKVFLLD